MLCFSIPVRSLGDKNYKYPEYTYDYYRVEGGLIPGSTLKKRPVKNAVCDLEEIGTIEL
jgi:hypothetical protein